MKSDKRVFFKLEGIPDLLDIRFLVFGKLPIENFKGLNFPKRLPNLEFLQIRENSLKSLKGLPSEMPNLKSIAIEGLQNLQKLEGFPNKLPRLSKIHLQNLPKLRSLKGLPPEIPLLNSLKIQDVGLITLKDLPEHHSPYFDLIIENYKPKNPVLFDLPRKTHLKHLHVEDYIIKDFYFVKESSFTKGFSGFTFENCLIHSFEGFPSFPENTNFKKIFDDFNEDFKIAETLIIFNIPTKIRSLSGLSLPFLQYLLPYYAENNKLFDFAPQGLELFKDCIDSEYIEQSQSSAKYLETLKFSTLESNPLEFTTLVSNPNEFNPNEIEEVQIYHERLQKALIIENLPPLHEYFKKSTIELAHIYIADPSSMPPDQIERLIHEADHNIRKILENSLPPKDPAILQISQKIAFTTKNGLRILN